MVDTIDTPVITMKNTIPLFMFFWVLKLGLLVIPGSNAAADERITAQELSGKLCSAQVHVLDLRDQDLWEQSKIKIKCARRVDPEDISAWIDTLPSDKEIILYCCS